MAPFTALHRVGVCFHGNTPQIHPKKRTPPLLCLFSRYTVSIQLFGRYVDFPVVPHRNTVINIDRLKNPGVSQRSKGHGMQQRGEVKHFGLPRVKPHP